MDDGKMQKVGNKETGERESNDSDAHQVIAEAEKTRQLLLELTPQALFDELVRRKKAFSK